MEADPSVAALIRQLEERLLEPREPLAALEELLAAEFIEFGSSGRVYDRRQAVAALQKPPTTGRFLADFKTEQLAPGVILATYRAIREGTAGKPSVHSLRSSIWKQIDGRWQMVFHQGTNASLSNAQDEGAL